MANCRKLCKSVRLYQFLFVLVTVTITAVILYKRMTWESQRDARFNADRQVNGKEETGADELDISKPFLGHKIVHLDLKGAAPKISYLSWFFPYIKKLGATGILIEYEDMFPYTSLDVSAKNAYSKNDIADILRMANKSSLEIIPLIQTFGHLEFVLKLEKYMHLREVYKYPQAICPSKQQSLEILKNMIDDVMLMHKGYIEYLHIGCDEVYQIGECNDCKVRNYNNKWNNEDLFLAHVTTLATYIRTVYPGVTPLIWDDHMRSISLTQLSSWKIGDLVEPVIWKYTTDVEAYLTGDLWYKYKIIFPNVWFGSAFKGAKYPDTMISPVEYYLDNHKSWKSVIAMYSNDVNFKGGILTGWQRFDHFSILCELLPVAIPSLAINIMYLSSNIKTLSELSVHVQKITGCSVFIYGDKRCSFPGNSLHEEIAKFSQLVYRIKLAKNHSIFKGWMTSYNLDNAFSNPSHVEEISKEILSLYMELMELETSIEMAMDEVYNNETTKEWINVYLEPYKNELKMIVDGRNKILATDHWPKRPIG